MRASVIVPVYEVPVPLLHACLGSLMAQTERDCEFVVVSDGAPAEEQSICEEFARKDSRFKFVKCEHAGVSAARNRGVAEAQGDYLAFVDADDRVEPDMLEKCLVFAEDSGADLVTMNLIVTAKGVDDFRTQKPESLEPESILRQILRGELFGGMQIRIIKTEFLRRQSVKWRENLGYCEDVIFWAEFLRRHPKVAYMDAAFYHYVQDNPKSITIDYTIEKFEERKKYIRILKELLPPSFSNEVKVAAFNVKLEAMRHGLLPAKEFIAFERTPLRIVWNSHLPRKTRALLCLHTILLVLFGKTYREYL